MLWSGLFLSFLQRTAHQKHNCPLQITLIADKPKFRQKEKPTKGFIKPNVSCAYGDPYGNRKSNIIFRFFRSLAVNPLFMRVWDALQFLPFCVIRGFWCNCSGQTADKIYKTHSQKRNRSVMIGSFLWTWIYFQTKIFFYTLFARNTARKNAADSLKSESVYSLMINSFLEYFSALFTN